MNRQSIFFVAALAAVSSLSAVVSAAVSPIFPLTSPAGWSVGTSLSTSAEWAAGSSLDPITGTPNVFFNDAGAGLTQPTLTAGGGGFVAGSGGLYNYAGPYTATAAIFAPTTSVPVGAGTYVIVQTFGTINPDFGSLLGVTLTDSSGVALSGVQHLHSELYSHFDTYPTTFGDVEAQASIDEFWIPGFTGDVKAVATMSIHSSLQEMRVDTILATPGAGDASPFSLTAVPEPASCALLGIGALAALARRRRGTV